MTLSDSLLFFIKESLSQQAIEICGFLGEKNGEYFPVIIKNKHSNPREQFSIDPLEYLKFCREHEMVAVFHSHVIGDCSASEFDKVNSDNTLIPFLIYSLCEKKFGLYEPQDHECNVKELKKLL